MTGVFGLGGSSQERRVHDAALDAKEQSRRAIERLATLEQRSARLAVVNEALWLLLKERFGLTEAELEEKVRAVDAAGGGNEALLATSQVDCPRCARRVSARHARCLYCGVELASSAREAPALPPDAPKT